MSFNLRFASSLDDAGLLLELIERLAQFEELEGPDHSARERFLIDGFERVPARFEALLAEWEEDEATPIAVGYALFFETYSTFLCRPTLYLEDLFVLPEYRGRGIGKALFLQCASTAVDRECGRMEWACLEWNRPAQDFYQSLGAERLRDWLGYRMTTEQLKELSRERGSSS